MFMKISTRKTLLALALASALGAASSSQAAIIGYFDMINVGMTDTAYGWICDTSSPYTAPSGNLVVYVEGSYYGEQSVTSAWGGARSDVASSCGRNGYAGWTIVGWLASDNSPGTEIYYRLPDNSLQLLGGSGKVCTQLGNCY
jgi:hypothetical protein